jgi:hypothetical protein
MRSSFPRFGKYYVRYKGGAPIILSYDGRSRYEFLSMLQAAFAPKFDGFTIDDLQLFKADKQIIDTNLGALVCGDFPGDSDVIVVGSRPKKITINQGEGKFTTYLVVSDGNLRDILRTIGSKYLVSPNNLEINSYKQLDDNVTYTVKITDISIFNNNSIEKRSFMNQNEFATYLAYENINSLISIDGKPVTNFFELKDGAVLLKPKKVTIKKYDPITDSRREEIKTFYSEFEFIEYLKRHKLSAIFETPEFRNEVNFNTLKPGETYFGIDKDSSWITNEMIVMEQEAVLAAKKKVEELLEKKDLDIQLIDKPRVFFSNNKKPIQEWDGLFYSASTDSLYILECKHKLTDENLRDILDRVSGFMGMLKSAKLSEDGLHDPFDKHFKPYYTHIRGIVCAGIFSPKLRKEAESSGLLTLVPSGNRYMPGGDWELV